MSKIIKRNHEGEQHYPLYERAVLELYVPEPEPESDYDDEDAEVFDPEEVAAARVEEIVQAAREEAELKIQEAYAEGLKRGTEAGLQAFQESVAEAARVYQAAIEQMVGERDRFLQRLEENLPGLIRAIVGRVLRVEAAGDAQAIRRVLKDVMQHVTERERLIVHLNPGDLEVLHRDAEGFFNGFDGLFKTQAVADDAVESGGCIVEGEGTYIDGQLDMQVERILERLTEPRDEPAQSE